MFHTSVRFLYSFNSTEPPEKPLQTLNKWILLLYIPLSLIIKQFKIDNIPTFTFFFFLDATCKNTFRSCTDFYNLWIWVSVERSYVHIIKFSSTWVRKACILHYSPWDINVDRYFISSILNIPQQYIINPL